MNRTEMNRNQHCECWFCRDLTKEQTDQYEPGSLGFILIGDQLFARTLRALYALEWLKKKTEAVSRGKQVVYTPDPRDEFDSWLHRILARAWREGMNAGAMHVFNFHTSMCSHTQEEADKEWDDIDYELDTELNNPYETKEKR